MKRLKIYLLKNYPETVKNIVSATIFMVTKYIYNTK